MPRFKIEQGLRFRVALALATFCIFITAGLGVSLYFASDDMEEAHIDQVIQMEMDHMVHLHRQHADFTPQIGSNLQSYVIRNLDEELRMPGYLRGLNNNYHRIDYNYQDIRVSVRHIDGIKFLIAYHTTLHQQRLSELRFLILFSLVAVVGIAFVVGYMLAGLLVKQVTDLAERVKLLVPEDAKGMILNNPEMDEEVAQLARALDDYQLRIQQILLREQEFTANISHELRTPITAILTSCELLNAEPELPDKVRVRINRIEAATARMGEQLQALLFLAREQSLGVIEPVAMTECVYDAADPLLSEIQRKHIVFEVNITPDVIVTLNRQALHTILMNLLRNAVQYTKNGFVRVEFSNNRLSVIDSGIGIEPAYLPLLYERFFRGSAQGQGLGIGLAIVKRICNHYAWLIEVESVPGSGSTFHIIFPE